MEGIGFAFLIAALFPFLIVLLLISLLALLPFLFWQRQKFTFSALSGSGLAASRFGPGWHFGL